MSRDAARRALYGLLLALAAIAWHGLATWDPRSHGYAPVVGSRLTLSPNEHWRFVVQGQYLDAGWGDFGDYKGDISRANALAEYRFTENVGVFVGYDWFKINAKRSRDNVEVGLDQRFKGPMAGVTFSF